MGWQRTNRIYRIKQNNRISRIKRVLRKIS
jgi:hypothetical protein